MNTIDLLRSHSELRATILTAKHELQRLGADRDVLLKLETVLWESRAVVRGVQPGPPEGARPQKAKVVEFDPNR